jgi:hypothetical protein
VTAPGDAAGRTALLAVVAAWDVPLLRRAVARLAGVAARLPPWRARLQAVGRATEDTWSGPAARSAVGAGAELAAVSWEVDRAVQFSLTAYERLASEAAQAQEFAVLALARASPPAVGELMAGSVLDLPLVSAAEDALAAARRAAAAGEESGTALAGLGVRDAFVPAGFGDLAAGLPLVGPVVPPPVPVGRPPDEVAAWWAGLAPGAQGAAIASAPTVLGALDGVPAWARDRANRRLLDRALADPDLPPRMAATAAAVDRALAAEEASGGEAQLRLLDLAGDRVAVAFGDPDTADVVAVLVPGIMTTPSDDLGALARNADAVDAAARAAAPGLAVAAVVWLGYRTPQSIPAASSRVSAWRGGPALASALAGLDAGRAATGAEPGRTTVLAHSYGTVVLDEAADAPGPLAADAVVLLGSPGMEEDATALEVEDVFDAGPPGDLVARLGWFGSPTGADAFGSTGLPVDDAMGHSDYYDPGFPTLAALGEVVAGARAGG